MLKIMHKIILLLLLGLPVASLFGCSQTRNTPAITRATVTENNKGIEKQLAETAESIERSLALLAMAQETNNPPLINTAPLITPEGGMGGTADIDWTGPLEPLLHKLAELTDYNLKFLGNEPTTPIIISITQNKAVIADIIKNAGLQAGKRANIMVFPANKIIELRYSSG